MRLYVLNLVPKSCSNRWNSIDVDVVLMIVPPIHPSLYMALHVDKAWKAVPQSNAVMFWTKLRKQGSCWEPDLIELSFQKSLIGTLRNVTWLCTCTKNPYHESPQSWISAVFKSYGQSLNEMFHSKPQVPSLDDLKKVSFANSVGGLIRNKIKQLENVQCIRPIGMWVTVSTCFNQLLTMAHKS